MNKAQKKILLFTSIIVLLSFVMWFVDGFEIITATKKVWVDTSQSSTGGQRIEDKFIWGLDLTLLISGVAMIIGGILYKRQDKIKI